MLNVSKQAKDSCVYCLVSKIPRKLMAEMAHRVTGLDNILKDLQGCPLNKEICEDIVKAFDSNHDIKPEVIENLLELCIQSPKDMTHAVLITTIVSTIGKKVNAGNFKDKPDLTHSMLKLFHMLKTKIYNSKLEEMMFLYFEVLLAYPDEVYTKLEERCFTEIKELLYLYMNQRIPIGIRAQPIHILNKYLKVLPPDKRLKVVKEGTNIWFLKLIPNVMVFSTTPNFKIETSLETLEIVADELLHIDYADNPNWQIVLQSIYTPQKYPAIMKNLLEKGSDIWHRLWIVFIKMLKNEITKNNNSVGSPINSMLPVVETAFKMDVNNRCRAFKCWNVLIDNFSTETIEVYINKRIKLLLIPLCSNNAKVEETAISKLNTWWHLIGRFHTKVKNFSEIILKPFLQFCFGKPAPYLKPVFVPGLITDKTKEYCIEAFINIVGHHDCKGCVSLPKLSGRLINNKNIVDNWKDLVYCLSLAIRNTASTLHKLRQPLKCGWISFLNVICDLPDDNVSRNLFNELLTMLENLIQGCCEEKLMDIVLNDLIMSIFDGNDKLLQLLKSRDEGMTYVQKIVSIMLNPTFEKLYNSYDMSDSVAKLKPFANYIIDQYIDKPATISNILEKMPATYNSLVLWAALAASICEKKYDGEVLSKMLLWPLSHMDLFTKVKFCSSLYELLHAKTCILPVDDEILKILMEYEDINATNSTFLLKTSIVLLKQKTSSDIEVECEKEIDLLIHIIKKIENLDYSHPMFSSIMDMLSQNFCKLTHCINVNIAKKFLSITQIMFMNILPDFKEASMVDAKLLLKVKEILMCIENIFKLEAYACLKETVLTELLECAPHFAQQQELKATVLAILQIISSDNMDTNHPSITDVKNLVDTLKDEVVIDLTTNPTDQSKFTTPGRASAKKTKQKETSIVNTVVENGEEFVVVKSNWKFNPKKLTDKQKEKFQRQRQDIPALYQDLSQSQDEFKLTTWKTDSQDTTSSSKSNGLCNTVNEEVSSILKNIDKNVVPKILKNIVTTNNEIRNLSPERSSENVMKIQSPVSKEVKTPRVALKDRVFRNVRNLIEKSKVLLEDKETKSLFDEIMKTPTGKSVQIASTILNSAPSEINLDRPTRVRRKPKKFEDLQVFTTKKRRHSLGNADSQSIDSTDDTSEEQDIPKNLDDEKQTVKLSETMSENEINQNRQSFNSSQLDSNDVETIHEVSCNDLSKNNNNLSKDKNSETKCKSYVAESDSHKMEIEVQSSDTNVQSVPCKSSDLTTESFEKNNEISNTTSDSSIQKPTIKRPGKKKLLIEKELAIDMVEGHPFLKVSQKRVTRKIATEYSNITRRKSLSQKVQKTKTHQINTPKVAKKSKEKDKLEVKLTNETQKFHIFLGSQDTSDSKDENGSQDIIESSQDSTVSIMSTKSTKNVQRIPIVKLQNIEAKSIIDKKCQEKNSLNANNDSTSYSVLSNCEIKDDSEFPRNKTAEERDNLTENMDTEPIGNVMSNDIIVIDSEDTPIVNDNKDAVIAEMDTQDIADADTQPLDQDKIFESIAVSVTSSDETQNLQSKKNQDKPMDNTGSICDTSTSTQEDITKTFSESLLYEAKNKEDISSILPLKDEDKRKQDFLNNTLEISPIKILSPVRDNKSTSPETSLDYMVIKLSSPVQSNGEPFEKFDSPEIFTEDKVSPDKRDQSPPREEILVANVSPKSLSVKKNKPQVRTGGRAAQMLGLCVPGPDRLQTIMNSEKSVETEETKKHCSSLNMSARRNLRILYNSTNENSETSEETEEDDHFLKLKRTLPSADSSPSVPILKRKLSDITDDATVSPASKRKRVSFHDPPVSTTVCVKKYIEPCGVRSPQNSIAKRQERQLRAQLAVNLKSQKRLDTAFKLEKALTKAIESFGDADIPPSTDDDTAMTSLEPIPLVEVVMNCELNDDEPICIDLIDCKDPIDNIACELSSPAMKPFLIKEFAGKIETVGDLAKMTELEINRLCIKMPKIQLTKKVLTDYMKKINKVANEVTLALDDQLIEKPVLVLKAVDVEVQTDWPVKSVDIQTEFLATSLVSTQTNTVHTLNCMIQTDESGSKSTADIVTSLLGKPDFIECLNKQLDTSSKQCIADNLPINALMDTFVQKLDQKQSTTVIDRLLEKHTSDSLNGRNDNLRLSFMQDYLSDRFSSKDLILFCSELLKKVIDKNI